MGAIKNEYSLDDSVRLAINAGNDMLLFTTTADDLIPNVINMIKTHVQTGAISKKRIDESYERIKKLKQRIV
jgi:beta-N-acetylhexosaminidase